MLTHAASTRAPFFPLFAIAALVASTLAGCATGHRIVECADGMQDNDGDGVCMAVCDDATCNDHGTCDDASGTATCTCSGGYVGVDCVACGAAMQDEDGDGVCSGECVASSCSGHGVCDDASGLAVCTCSGGYVGATCAACDAGLQDSDADGVCVASCTATTCNGHGVCDDASGVAVCTCAGGYVGADCAACDVGQQDNDADGACAATCSLASCSGHGACDDASGTVTCTCTGGYAGIDCAACGAMLQDADGDGTCTAACSPTTCSGHGSCDDTTGTATCTCSGGYVGATCASCDVGLQDNDADGSCLASCTLATCSGHGSCDDASGLAVCTCGGGYVGADCAACELGSQDNDSDGLCSAVCTASTCSGHGTCSDASGTATCACAGGYIGADCAACAVGTQDNDADGTCAPACTVSTCSGHGSCDDSSGLGVCTCAGGYVGSACASCAVGLQDNDGDGTCVAACTASTCSGHGSCDDGSGAAVCACSGNYVGATCASCDVGLQDNDANGICAATCTGSSCSGHGSCSDASGTASCTCGGNYVGASCASCDVGLQDNDADGVCTASCTAATCSGHGSCDDGSGTATCTCAGSYVGVSCASCDVGLQDNDADGTCTASCAASTCTGHGTCVDATGTATCSCAAGFSGTSCEYHLVYSLVIPTAANWDTVAAVPYATNNTASVRAFDRVAYVLTLDSKTARAEMDPFTDVPTELGIPADVVFQRAVANLTVTSNVAGVSAVTNSSTGTIEFFHNCYSYEPGHWDADDAIQEHRPDCYGAMQVFDGANDVFSYNKWSNGGTADVGIGNQGALDTDWSFASNAGSFATRGLEVYVREPYACTAALCGSHGTCALGGGFPECTCATGYTGLDCLGCAAGFNDEDGDGTCVLDCAGSACDGLDDAWGLATGVHTLRLVSGDTPVYVDGTTDGGGFVLIGRGRNDWRWTSDGRGTPAEVLAGLGTSSAFTPRYMDSTIVDELMANTPGSIGLDDVQLLIKRAATTTGSSSQNAYWSFTSNIDFTWQFGIQSLPMHAVVSASALGAGAVFDGTANDARPNGINDDHLRTFTGPFGARNSTAGFAYGSTVAAGSNDDVNFWYEQANENSAAPYTEVYVRLPTCQNATVCANGTCNDASGVAVCTCSTGYAGEACDTCASGYSGTPCTLVGAPVGTSCKDILANFPSSTSGTYVIDLDGAGATYGSMTVQCDMATDGGGWTLVENYLHLGDTNPSLVTWTTGFPREGSSTLGVDESASTTTWGHATPTLVAALAPTTIRFYGATTSHARVIHFKTNSCLAYFTTGTGTCSGVATNFTSLPGHTANLPGSATSYFTNQGTSAMTQFPFYTTGNYHWGVRGSGGRWDVDDYVQLATAGDADKYSTLHRIWVR